MLYSEYLQELIILNFGMIQNRMKPMMFCSTDTSSTCSAPKQMKIQGTHHPPLGRMRRSLRRRWRSPGHPVSPVWAPGSHHSPRPGPVARTQIAPMWTPDLCIGKWFVLQEASWIHQAYNQMIQKNEFGTISFLLYITEMEL